MQNAVITTKFAFFAHRLPDPEFRPKVQKMKVGVRPTFEQKH